MTTSAFAFELPRVVDSTQLDAARVCLSKFQFEYGYGLRGGEPAVDLPAGGAFAAGRAAAYARAYAKPPISEEWTEHREDGVHLGGIVTTSNMSPVDEARLAFEEAWGSFALPEGSKSPKTKAGTWAALVSYLRKYRPGEDAFTPFSTPDGRSPFELALSLPLTPETTGIGPWPMHPSGLPFLYAGRLDALGLVGGTLPAVLDDKTTARFVDATLWAKGLEMRAQFRGYCVRGDTEVLTRVGWSRIDELKAGEDIAQWSQNHTIQFVCPTAIHSPRYTGELYHLHSRSHEIFATPDHRQPIFDVYPNELRDFTMATLPMSRGSGRLMSGGFKTDGDIWDPNFVRFLVALQADGHYVKPHERQISFSFRKARKIVRLEALLLALDTPYNRRVDQEGITHFWLPDSELVRKATAVLGPRKTFGGWLLGLHGESLTVFIDELPLWDGTRYKNGKEIYTTSIRANADWVLAVACLCNRFASYHTQTYVVDGEERLQHRVCVTKTNWHSMPSQEVDRVPWDGPVYCVTVPSSYFLIRMNGKVTVTGNCWLAQKLIDPRIEHVVVRQTAIRASGPEHREAGPFLVSRLDIAKWLETTRATLQAIVEADKVALWPAVLGDACTAWNRPCEFMGPCRARDPESQFQGFRVERWNPLSGAEQPSVPR